MPPPSKNNHTPQHGNTSNRERLCRIILSASVKISFPHGKQRPDTAQPPDPVSTEAPTGSAAQGLRGKAMAELKATQPHRPKEQTAGLHQPAPLAWQGKAIYSYSVSRRGTPLTPLAGVGGGWLESLPCKRRDNIPVAPLGSGFRDTGWLGSSQGPAHRCYLQPTPPVQQHPLSDDAHELLQN